MSASRHFTGGHWDNHWITAHWLTEEFIPENFRIKCVFVSLQADTLQTTLHPSGLSTKLIVPELTAHIEECP